MPNSKALLGSLFATSLFLSGCVSTAEGILDGVAGGIQDAFFSLDENDCSVSDWNKAGYDAAKKDYASSRVESYQKYCPKYGVSVNEAEFKTGHARGLKDHCTAELGMKRGESAFVYASPCSDIPVYQSAYEAGTKNRAEETIASKDEISGCSASGGINQSLGGGVSIISGRGLTGAKDKVPGDRQKYNSMVSGIEEAIRSANEASAKANSYTKGTSNWRKWAKEFTERYNVYAERQNELSYYMAEHCVEGVTSSKVFPPVRPPNGLRRK